jgi:alginate O-acetyltransferase complex protein AlgI
MASTSFQFFIFAFAVVLAYNLHRSLVWRQSVLLAANLLFLASFSLGRWSSFLPLAAFVGLGFAGLEWIRSNPKRAFLPLLIGTLAIFVWLKKYAFVSGSLFLASPYVTVGISYILFRLLHLMIDTRSGDLPNRIPLISYLNYTLNFTTLLAGPIQPYQEFAKMQLDAPQNRLNVRSALPAIERIVIGLFKTDVLALLASTLHSRSIEALTAPGPVTWKILDGAAAVASYPIFLYCNFSGYIDIMIGIGRLLGFTLPENFDRPFFSDNFINFWSRWHITLSNWLKTYVYYPLLMTLMRRFPVPALGTVWLGVALFVTFFLVGLWHGQTSEFIFFGFLQGFGMVANRVYQIVMTRRMGRKRFESLSSNGFYVAISRGFTFTWFTFTLLWFWSNWAQLRAIRLALTGESLGAVWMAIFAGSTVLLAVWEGLRRRILEAQCDGGPVVHSQYWRAAQGAAMAVVLLTVTLLMNQSAPENVYKAF